MEHIAFEMLLEETEIYPAHKRKKLEINNIVIEERRYQFERRIFSVDESKYLFGKHQHLTDLHTLTTVANCKSDTLDFQLTNSKQVTDVNYHCILNLENSLNNEEGNKEHKVHNAQKEKDFDLHAIGEYSKRKLCCMWNINKSCNDTLEPCKAQLSTAGTTFTVHRTENTHLPHVKVLEQKIDQNEILEECQPFYNIYCTFGEMRTGDKNCNTEQFLTGKVKELCNCYNLESIKSLNKKERCISLPLQRQSFDEILFVKIPQDAFFCTDKTLSSLHELRYGISSQHSKKITEQKYIQSDSHHSAFSKVYHCQHSYDIKVQILQNEKNIVNSSSDNNDNRQCCSTHQDAWDLATEEQQRGSHRKDKYTCRQEFIWKNMKSKLQVNIKETEYNRGQKGKKRDSRSENYKYSNVKNILKRSRVKENRMYEIIYNQFVQIFKSLKDKIEDKTVPLISDVSSGSFSFHNKIYCTKNRFIFQKRKTKHLALDIFYVKQNSAEKYVHENGDIICSINQCCLNSPLFDNGINFEKSKEFQEKVMANPELHHDTVKFDCIKKFGLELFYTDLYTQDLNITSFQNKASLLSEELVFNTKYNMSSKKKEQNYTYSNESRFQKNSSDFSVLFEEKDYMKVKHLCITTMILSEESPHACSMSLQENKMDIAGKIPDLPENYNRSLHCLASKIKRQKVLYPGFSYMSELIRTSRKINFKKKEENKLYFNLLPASRMVKKLHSVKKYKTSQSNNLKNNSNMNFAEETIYVFPEYPRTCGLASLEQKEYKMLHEKQENANFCFAKKSNLFFVDTFEKIPLCTDFEELNKIILVTQNSISDGYTEKNTVSSTIKREHRCTDTISSVWTLTELASTDKMDCHPGLLQHGQLTGPQYSRATNIHNQDRTREMKLMETSVSCSHSENIFHIPTNSKHCESTLFGIGSFEKKKEVTHSHNSTTEKEQITVPSSREIEHNHYPRNEKMNTYPALCSKVSNNNMNVTLRSEFEGFCNKYLSFINNKINQDSTFCLLNSKHLGMKWKGHHFTETKEIAFKTSCDAERNKHQITVHNILKGIVLSNEMNNGYQNVTPMHTPTENRRNNSFELKTQFDLVLEELSMFHEISKQEERDPCNKKLTSAQKYLLEMSNKPGDVIVIKEELHNVSQNKCCISLFDCDTSVNENKSKENHEFHEKNLVTGKGQQEVSFEYGSSGATEGSHYSTYEEGYNTAGSGTALTGAPAKEQRRLLLQRSMLTTKNGLSPLEQIKIIKQTNRGLIITRILAILYRSQNPVMFKTLEYPDITRTVKENTPTDSKSATLWSPAFMQERNNNLHTDKGCSLSHGIVRVQPLITCNGPIRIGLSKKAKPKQLHPYLK